VRQLAVRKYRRYHALGRFGQTVSAPAQFEWTQMAEKLLSGPRIRGPPTLNLTIIEQPTPTGAGGLPARRVDQIEIIASDEKEFFALCFKEKIFGPGQGDADSSQKGGCAVVVYFGG